MEINRPIYIQQLLDCKHNGMIKIITGIRRCGKSYLLFHLFRDWLVRNGVDDRHIIAINLEDRRRQTLRNPDVLLAYIDSQIKDDKMHYVLLDEIQIVPEFEDVLNSYLDMPNVDVYVTGSNARFLSKDVITEFRGRGHEIRIYPLSFSEFMSAYEGSTERGIDEYMTYGGLPKVLQYSQEQQKAYYLKQLFSKVYISDIVNRYHVRNEDEMRELLNFISSAVGSLTNPHKLANTFQSIKNSKLNAETIKNWLEYFEDAFLVGSALRYDVKGKHYIDTPSKYYFSDLGLRNACLNFRQHEESHLMENLIYNELLYRGFNVDVGVVPVEIRDENGKRKNVQLEVDFVCNQGSKRYYIQSAFRMENEDKIRQERQSLVRIGDSFKKFIIVGNDSLVHRDEQGITTLGLKDFLLHSDSLEW